METFLEVCDRMNFTHAGDALGLTQPAVSRQMKALETHYGVPLFDYAGKKLVLTAAGERLRRAARAMRADEERLRRALKTHAPRVLRLGCTPTPGQFLLPARLADYLAAQPCTEVRMTVRNTARLLTLLDAGEIDFAVVEGNFPKQDYAHLLFSRQLFAPVCAADSPIAGGTLEALLGHTLVLREVGSGNREILTHCLERENRTVEDFAARVEVDNVSAQKALVRAGCGVAFLFGAAVEDELRAGTLRTLAVEGFPVAHEINFIWRRDSIFAAEYRTLALALGAQASQS